MVMTQQDFVDLAAVLRDTDATERTIRSVADVCARRNPRFNNERFLTAAGLPKRQQEGERDD